MRNCFILLAFIAIVSFPALAGSPHPQASNGNGAPKYDLATEAKIAGVVQEVKTYQCKISGALGTHLLVKTDSGEVIEVHVGATKFMNNYGFTFNVGDKVTIVGSKVKFDGKDTIIARTLEREDMNMTFRDPQGKPLW